MKKLTNEMKDGGEMCAKSLLYSLGMLNMQFEGREELPLEVARERAIRTYEKKKESEK